MKMLLIILANLLAACFSDDEQSSVESIRAPLREYCLMERQIGTTTQDSVIQIADAIKKKIDSLGKGIPANSVQRLSTKIPECVDLYRWRMKNPRPKRKIEYINVD